MYVVQYLKKVTLWIIYAYSKGKRLPHLKIAVFINTKAFYCKAFSTD